MGDTCTLSYSRGRSKTWAYRFVVSVSNTVKPRYKIKTKQDYISTQISSVIIYRGIGTQRTEHSMLVCALWKGVRGPSPQCLLLLMLLHEECKSELSHHLVCTYRQDRSYYRTNLITQHIQLTTKWFHKEVPKVQVENKAYKEQSQREGQKQFPMTSLLILKQS